MEAGCDHWLMQRKRLALFETDLPLTVLNVRCMKRAMHVSKTLTRHTEYTCLFFLGKYYTMSKKFS